MSVTFDWDRAKRTGVPEAVFCPGKSGEQLAGILDDARARKTTILLTRMTDGQHCALPDRHREAVDYDPVSRTAVFGELQALRTSGEVGIVTAGSSDLPVACEAMRTLRFLGHEACLVTDVGVAGLWRLLDKVEQLRSYRILIAVAGMEGALFSTVTGLVPGLVIAVPSSVGYGVSQGGKAALTSALASCATGIVVVNIDNGFGAACAAQKVLDPLPLRPFSLAE
jgi:pyridinium-3,5-biscarboxylic acid mononucleotide synthase